MEQKKILIVEDDAFLREVYADSLKGEGYIIDIAVDGDQAMQKLKAGVYDLILFDILLPKMNGFQVLDLLKQDPTYKLNPASIVFLTNLDSENDIKKAMEYGSGYLIKSQITPGDLIREVKMYLEKNKPMAPPIAVA